MNRIGLLFSLLTLIWFWTRLLRQVFSSLTKIKVSKIWLFLRGLALVAIFLGYQRLIQQFGSQFSIPSIKEQFSPLAVLTFWFYCGIIALILPLTFSLSKNKKIWLQIGIGLTSFLFFFLSGNPRSLGAILLLAYSEEFFKFSIAHLHSEKANSESVSKLLLFSLLIAFSFSIAENIFAIGSKLVIGDTITGWFLLGRGLLANLIHITATGSIAYLMMKIPSKFTPFLALGLGFWIHSLYNISLHFQQNRITILLALWGLFAIGYLLFHLDELYSVK